MQRTFRTVQKAEGRRLVIELPEELANQEVEITAQAAIDPITREAERQAALDELRALREKYNVDLSDYKFNRDELYDRPSLR